MWTDIARHKFNQQFPGALDDALGILQLGEHKLQKAISTWEQQQPGESVTAPKSRVIRYHKYLAETRFRIGELLMLHKRFDGAEGALGYLQQAIEDARRGDDTYRYDNAVQSYANALYLSDNADFPDSKKEEKRRQLEKELEKKLDLQEGRSYPSIMGRLRIAQGDVLFSSYFKRDEQRTHEYDEYVQYRSRLVDFKVLRVMLRRYVEACSFMLQHNSISFAAAVRVLQRRIEMISDQVALQEIQWGLRHVWTDQDPLRDKDEELETLIQLAKIRSEMLAHEKRK